jgi:hypothetical protein
MPVSFVITEGLGPAATGISGTNLQISSLVAGLGTLTITLTDPAFVAGDASVFSHWLITGPTSMSVTGMSAVSNTISLTTTEALNGGAYTLSIPIGIVRQADAVPLIPPYTQAFTGVGAAPTVAMAIVSNDARSFDVLFSESVLDTEAVIPANYVITPTLTVQSVTKVSDNRYTIKTVEAQLPGQLYLVTVSGVHDLAGNII